MEATSFKDQGLLKAKLKVEFSVQYHRGSGQIKHERKMGVKHNGTKLPLFACVTVSASSTASTSAGVALAHPHHPASS